MTISVFDVFKIGIGPSSSHTVGPMRAALEFAGGLREDRLLQRVDAVQVELFGSLGAIGKGHGTDSAILMGLEGEAPESVDPDRMAERVSRIRERGSLFLLGEREIELSETQHLIFRPSASLPLHPNGMRFTASRGAETIRREVYYSIGGGFVMDEQGAPRGPGGNGGPPPPHPFASAAELLGLCAQRGLSVSQLMMENEKASRSEAEIRRRLLDIWRVMQECAARGSRTGGVLPGGLTLPRRAADLHRKLSSQPEGATTDPLAAIDWVNMYAMAVSEENAAGGRVVTAPTNGAAGVVPAVLLYYDRFCGGADADAVVRFLLTSAAVGILLKENASISGAEVGCQGEIGSACSMAAAALSEALGGTPAQVENAAEIGMEHSLGLTCDPVGGLVQIPCIERNAVAAVQAITAARMALRGDGRHFVSLDSVIKTMRDTGADMKAKYKETSRGGLAVNVTEC